MRSSALLLAASVSLLSCSGEPPVPLAPPPSATPSTTAVEQPPAPPEGMRLPTTVIPNKIAATLTLDPKDKRFTGVAHVDLSFGEPSRVVWLNAASLTVSKATLEAGGAKQEARVVPGAKDKDTVQSVGFVVAQPVSGAAKLVVEYSGEISDKEDRGVFLEEEGGDKYLFTQFESTEARRAFPCFDEPSFKHPWQLTLRVPKGNVAVSNTKLVSQREDQGYVEHHFAETKPLPSYLVAFAVGPFEVIDAGSFGKGKTPVRVLAPKGKAARAAYAKSFTGKVLETLERYFDIPYPYDKLDIVPIPHLATFGAMENAGLITANANIVLVDEDARDKRFERRFSVYMSHEIAHQWFGDLVTLAWWDDIWLNEAFAAWMEDKMAGELHPDAGFDVDVIFNASWAKEQDSLVSARKIRQEITTYDDIKSAFDGITYEKGGAVVGMFESYLGKDPFRAGLQRYFNAHAHKNATAKDFLADMSAGAGRDVSAAFSTFLDQPGVPLVQASCDDKASPPALTLTQERYLPAGSKGASKDALWKIPMCIHYEGGKQCLLLEDKSAKVALKDQKRCPKWVMPKANAAGYYTVAYSPKELRALLTAKGSSLTRAERIDVALDARALVTAGKLDRGAALELAGLFSKETDDEVLRAAVGLAATREDVLDKADRDKYQRFIAKTFGKKAKALGIMDTGADTGAMRKLRAWIVPWVARTDKALLDEAEKIADRWFNGDRAVLPEAAEMALRIRVAHGDKRVLGKLTEIVQKEQDPGRRDRAIRALNAVLDPALVPEVMKLVLDPKVDPRDTFRFFYLDPLVSGALFDFIEKNIDALFARIPQDARSVMLDAMSSACSKDMAARVEKLFKDRVGAIGGGPRSYAQAIETIGLCAEHASAETPSVKAFLKKH